MASRASRRLSQGAVTLARSRGREIGLTRKRKRHGLAATTSGCFRPMRRSQTPYSKARCIQARTLVWSEVCNALAGSEKHNATPAFSSRIPSSASSDRLSVGSNPPTAR